MPACAVRLEECSPARAFGGSDYVALRKPENPLLFCLRVRIDISMQSLHATNPPGVALLYIVPQGPLSAYPTHPTIYCSVRCAATGVTPLLLGDQSLHDVFSLSSVMHLAYIYCYVAGSCAGLHQFSCFCISKAPPLPRAAVFQCRGHAVLEMPSSVADWWLLIPMPRNRS